ncbi:S1 family peptidase [Salininema proteolyticum]|uniref:S1 family peptidase n=1 Tax=Salininema proteolyticum TaxID=1607685 RepID=A0ABV8U496_9ACTN
MKRKAILAAAGAAAVTAAYALTAAGPAMADSLQSRTAEARADLEGAVSPELIAAMTDQLGLTRSEAHDRLAVEAVASDLDTELADDYGAGYAGVWIDPDGSVTAASTSLGETAPSGVDTVVVDHSMAELESVTDSFEAAGETDGIAGWYIDVRDNTVVLEATDPAAADSLVADAGADPSAVDITVADEAYEPYYVRGGDAYNVENSWRCSVGFAVTKGSAKGFTTAGHCGEPGDRVTGGNASPGIFEDSIFPRNDGAWASVGSDQTLYNIVNTYNGSRHVYDSDEAAVGSSVCRSGSTTGWQCGYIEAKKQTVHYPQGTVRGLTRTSACAEPGDSGGSFITGNSAQGMTSGGSGDCRRGGTTFFQPINPILKKWHLKLVTRTVD